MENDYNLRNYVITIKPAPFDNDEGVVEIHEKHEHWTTGSKFALICFRSNFEQFLTCLNSGRTGRMELSDRCRSIDAYRTAIVYDEITDNVIGTFEFGLIALENRKSKVEKEEIEKIRHLLYTLYQIQKRVDINVGFVPDSVPDNPISFKKFEYSQTPSGEPVINGKIITGLFNPNDLSSYGEFLTDKSNDAPTATDWCNENRRRISREIQKEKDMILKADHVKFDYNQEQYDFIIQTFPGTVDKTVHIRANESMDNENNDVQFSLSCYLNTFNDIVEHLMAAEQMELHELEKDDGVYTTITLYDINTKESTDFHVMGVTLEENSTFADRETLTKIFYLVHGLMKVWNEAHPENHNKRIYSQEALAQIHDQLQKFAKKHENDRYLFEQNAEHPQ